jgi:hypothetical protein
VHLFRERIPSMLPCNEPSKTTRSRPDRHLADAFGGDLHGRGLLAVSRRKKASVAASADLTDAKLMADAALAGPGGCLSNSGRDQCGGLRFSGVHQLRGPGGLFPSAAQPS